MVDGAVFEYERAHTRSFPRVRVRVGSAHGCVGSGRVRFRARRYLSCSLLEGTLRGWFALPGITFDSDFLPSLAPFKTASAKNPQSMSKRIAPLDELIPKLFTGFTPAAAFVPILHITVKDPNQAAA